MESHVKVFGHAVHPILIPLPLGLLSGSVAFDLLHRVSGDRAWGTAATSTLGAGLVGGLVAAPFGLVDWLALPDGTRAKRVGLLHGIGNAGMLSLFGASWWLRREEPETLQSGPFALSLAGLTMAALAGWLGGELVERMGVGVDLGANLNAPSSLSDQPARTIPPERLAKMSGEQPVGREEPAADAGR